MNASRRRVAATLVVLGGLALPRSAASQTPTSTDSVAEAGSESGATPPEPSVPSTVPHLRSLALGTWIWPTPSATGRYLGYVRVGRSIALRAEKLVPGPKCFGGFYAVEPRGYVCNDRTVLRHDAKPREVRASGSGGTAQPLPYRYAISDGAPAYRRLPTAEEQRVREWAFGPARRPTGPPRYAWGHEHLASPDPIAPVDPLPESAATRSATRTRGLQPLRRILHPGTMFAFTKAFDHEGRTFLLNEDGTFVPADRVREYRVSDFEGVTLTKEHSLPIAWIRGGGRPRFALVGDKLLQLPDPFEPRSHAWPTGKTRIDGRQRFLELSTTEGWLVWARAEDATIVEPQLRRPRGVKPGDKWLFVRITEGTLVAYEDLRPVFVTLVSPGRGGPPRRGGDPVKDSTTPTGTFKVTFKDRANTMSPTFGPNRTFWIADVPYIQYFNAPFALHTAYWHERFGEPMSGGCVNVSPRDGATLFDWTEPHVPRGWQGATGTGAPENGRATWVVIRR